MAQEPKEPATPSTAKRDTRDIVRLVVFGLGLVLLIAFIVGQLGVGQGQLRLLRHHGPA